MDYILSQIQEEKDLCRRSPEQYMNYCRIEVEYAFVFMLGYLWNKNVTRLDDDTREVVFQKIARPSIGTIVEICRMLDLDSDFFGSKKAKVAINDYPTIRNKSFGHGFVFEDGIQDVINELEILSTDLFAPNSMLSEKFQIILVENINGDLAQGVRFGTDNRKHSWQCAADAAEFKPDNVYAMKGINDYTRLSPFIIVTRQRDYYLFKDVKDRMTGSTIYNQLFTTGSEIRNWPDFAVDISNDGVRRKSVNGTILNVYENNFKQYIDTGTKRRDIEKFLISNRASVCGTVWGHGGVGKTATVQSICDDLSLREDRRFDYIVFASAKDRSFKYTTGQIVDIGEPIDSYRNLISCINSTIGAQNTDEVQEIVGFKGKLLIIIDDYETFPQTEKTQIVELIEKLDVNHHKVLITTRANVIIGQEFATNELNKSETVKFLKEVMQSEFPDSQVLGGYNDLEGEDIQRRIFEVTSGRPLFIFQFAYVWVQMESLEAALSHKIRNQEEAIEFLFGRIFGYLSDEGRTIFRAISLLVTDSDLTNLVEKLRFIVNMENEEDKFVRGLEELVKLRVIEVRETGLFSVYSVEILNIMQKEYKSAPQSWQGGVAQRLNQVTRDKELDTEQALLRNADGARYAGRPQKEVSDLYRQILNRRSSPANVKSRALLNLAAYLFTSRGDKEGAIGVFEEYWERFRRDPLVAKMYAHYCWSGGKREKAIEVLMNILRSRTRKPAFELSGLCLTFHSILLIERKEDLKARRRVRDISEKNFDEQNKSINQDLRALLAQQGRPLFQRIREHGLEKLNSEERQNVVIGLYHFSGICVRLWEFNLAIEICSFMLDRSLNFYRNEFEKRREYTLSRLSKTRSTS